MSSLFVSNLLHQVKYLLWRWKNPEVYMSWDWVRQLRRESFKEKQNDRRD